jgi:hypothetical protein
VEKEPVVRALDTELLEDIDNDVKEEKGEGASLAKAATKLDPPSRNPIEEDRGVTCFVEGFIEARKIHVCHKVGTLLQ